MILRTIFSVSVLLVTAAGSASAQVMNLSLIDDPRVEMAVDFLRNGLVDDGKRMLLQVLHDDTTEPALKCEARYWLGSRAYNEGAYLASFAMLEELINTCPSSDRAREASRFIDRISHDAALAEALARPVPLIYVRNEIEAEPISIGRRDINVTGIGVFYASPVPQYYKFIQLTNTSFWGDERRALVSSAEIPELEKALESIVSVSARWQLRAEQSGGATFRTEDGLVIGVTQDLVVENPYLDNSPSSEQLVWFLDLDDRRIEVPDATLPSALISRMREVNAQLDEVNPASWWAD
jgi:hypothetical protein